MIMINGRGRKEITIDTTTEQRRRGKKGTRRREMVSAMYTYDTQKVITLRSTSPANDTINALTQTRCRSLGIAVSKWPARDVSAGNNASLSLTWLTMH